MFETLPIVSLDPSHILNAMGIGAVLGIYLVPSAIIILGSYKTYTMLKRKRQLKKLEKQKKEEIKQKQKKLEKENKQKSKQIKARRLEEITPESFDDKGEPKHKEEYNSLELEFNEEGYVKNGKTK